MDYNLLKEHKSTTRAAFSKMLVFMKDEKRNLYFAFAVMLTNSGISLLTPYLIGYTIDHYVVTKLYKGLLLFCGILLGLYILSALTEYFQTKLMGNIGQRMLFSLRKEIFKKIQSLPVDFFNQNKSGDLIARINNDTQTVNQFFSQHLMRFIDSIFMMLVSGIFLLVLHTSLGGASLIPAVFILLFVKFVNPWVKKKNAVSMKMSGLLSGEVQESLSNFKTIVAFNRRDFFREKFDKANKENYQASVISGIANGIYTPVFTLLSNIAQLIVLTYGIYLIATGHFTIGLLISYIAYVQYFYQPLRQMATLWASFQSAMASWDRIAAILELESDLEYGKTEDHPTSANAPIISFQHVSFQYHNGKKVLEDINIELHKGKTYAFVGPTGGGKTTTASLIARLYDPYEGEIKLDGVPIKEFTAAALSKKIGFILQEPFLFHGNLKENILYGNEELKNLSDEELMNLLAENKLDNLTQRFDKGLQTNVSAEGEGMSLGEKQIIAFIRAVLRKPELLIMDEATANIDTVTEKELERILDQLPHDTTKVIIAHRLNTIANADQIFFVNAGKLEYAGSLDDAMKMLLENKRES